jgi:hypothetical protein
VYKEVGSIDIVFANAGVVDIGVFLEKNEGEPTRPNLKTLEVNVHGTLYCECSGTSLLENKKLRGV